MTDPLEFAELMEDLEIDIRMVEGNGLSSVTDALMSIREILRILMKRKSVTDSRAALEERGAIAFKKWHMEGDWADTSGGRTGGQLLADFCEQESSSLKLLLSAICKGDVRIDRWDDKRGEVCCNGLRYAVELDSSGIPVLTPEIVEALEAAK